MFERYYLKNPKNGYYFRGKSYNPKTIFMGQNWTPFCDYAKAFTSEKAARDALAATKREDLVIAHYRDGEWIHE